MAGSRVMIIDVPVVLLMPSLDLEKEVVDAVVMDAARVTIGAVGEGIMAAVVEDTTIQARDVKYMLAGGLER